MRLPGPAPTLVPARNGLGPSLQAHPRAEGSGGERLNPVPRGARAGAGASAPGNAFASAPGRRRLQGSTWKWRWGCGGGREEGAGSSGGFRGASGTRDCSRDPGDPALGRLLRDSLSPSPGSGHPSPYLVVWGPREKLQALEMAPRHSGLWFSAEAKLTCRAGRFLRVLSPAW